MGARPQIPVRVEGAVADQGIAQDVDLAQRGEDKSLGDDVNAEGVLEGTLDVGDVPDTGLGDVLDLILTRRARTTLSVTTH